MRKKITTRRENILAREREQKVLEMRKAGATCHEIGIALGVTHQAVSKILKNIFENFKTQRTESAEEVRLLELERLDALLLGLWQAARAGDPLLVDRVLKIMERRSKYLALDMPTETLSTQIIKTDLDATQLRNQILARLDVEVDAK